jgi:hypothetical protein
MGRENEVESSKHITTINTDTVDVCDKYVAETLLVNPFVF